jgi:hypothetical protein
MKYEPLIKDILKHTKRAGLTEETKSLEAALNMVKVVPKAINDMMIVRRLQNCEGKISRQEKLLMHGTLYCIECNPNERKPSTLQKSMELEVFLFQQVVIFAQIIGKKSQFSEPFFDYKSHIQVSIKEFF